MSEDDIEAAKDWKEGWTIEQEWYSFYTPLNEDVMYAFLQAQRIKIRNSKNVEMTQLDRNFKENYEFAHRILSFESEQLLQEFIEKPAEQFSRNLCFKPISATDNQNRNALTVFSSTGDGSFSVLLKIKVGDDVPFIDVYTLTGRSGEDADGQNDYKSPGSGPWRPGEVTIWPAKMEKITDPVTTTIEIQNREKNTSDRLEVLVLEVSASGNGREAQRDYSEDNNGVFFNKDY